MIVNPYHAPSFLLRAQAALDVGILSPHFPIAYERMIIPLRRKLYDNSLNGIVNTMLSEMLGSGEMPLFSNIEIETINRCNGACSFCPVNRKAERRPLTLMERELFESIVRQLGEIGYRGTMGMYANNEPLLDSRVYDFCGIARGGLPGAFLYMFTNGSLLTVERLKDLMRHLDALIINNYDDGQKLSAPLADVARFVENDPILREKVFIYLRRQNEFRTNRGGGAPNRHRIIQLSSRCLMPFAQMVVRPDGKLSLCCCDTYGSITMGDLKEEGLLEAWRGGRYTDVRRRMLAGRKHISMCRACDGLTPVNLGQIPHPLMEPHPGSVVRIA